MFPGMQQFIMYFADSGRKMGTRCNIHSALVEEMAELLGKENVVVK